MNTSCRPSWPKKSLVALSLAATLLLGACGSDASTTTGTDSAAASGEVVPGEDVPPAADADGGAQPPAPGGAAPGAPAPDLAEAAETLGVSVAQLESALGGPPPDFEAAAEALDLSVDELMAAIPSDATPG